MIKQDKGHTEQEGNTNMLISELSLLTTIVVEGIVERTGVPYEEIMGELSKSIRMYKLTRAGMTPEEAVKIVGLEVCGMTQFDVDGTTREVVVS